jgi:hypothetical protein
MRVMVGPFAGMKFNVPNFNTAMLLGTWEKELWPLMETFKNARPTEIICIGAAEGYYAVGLAKMFPKVPVIAFEQSPEYLNFLTNLSSANNCNNVITKGECNCCNFEHALLETKENPLVFCDIEGGEIEILDKSRVPSLSHARILVEVHEMYVEGCQQKLMERFSDTHSAEVFKGEDREIKDFPAMFFFLRFLSSRKKILSLMGEGRPYPMNWIYFVPNKSSL